MPTGKGAVGVPKDLCVVMGVQVNETRCYVHAIAVDDPSCVSMVDSADGRDATPGYSDISRHPRSAAAVENQSVLDEDVVTHLWSSPANSCLCASVDLASLVMSTPLIWLERVSFYPKYKSTKLVSYPVLMHIDVQRHGPEVSVSALETSSLAQPITPLGSLQQLHRFR